MTSRSIVRASVRGLFRLPSLALAAWTSCLGLLTLMAVLLKARAWHPHFLPVTVVLGVFLVAGGALVLGGLWRLVLGPGRLRALTWLLLGLAPLLVMAGYFLYGLKAGYGRRIVVDLPRKLLTPFGESVLDLAARIRYPTRTEGETVVMISRPLARASAQVAAMDRHVRALRERLGGRTTDLRVHWVRGPLLGTQGRAIVGMCLGSLPGADPADAEGLAVVDRHEVAHCVLSSFLPPAEVDPPALLVEGWAEANSGTGEAGVADFAWQMRQNGQARSLRELTGPDWYSLHQQPVYFQGAPLVNYILRTYGPDKFLTLYATCRQATFADDCRRVLGVSLDELDQACWADVERIVGPRASLAARLSLLEVKHPVTPAAWKAFLDEYLAEAAVLVRPYEHVRVAGEFRFMENEGGKAATSIHRFDYRRSGADCRLILRLPDAEVALLATPEGSFEAHRNSKDAPWEVEDQPNRDPSASYRRVSSRIEASEHVSKAAVAFLDLVEGLRHRKDTSHVSVTGLERYSEGGRQLVRVRLVDESRSERMPWRSVTSVMDAGNHLAAHSDVVEVGNGTTVRWEHSYEIRDGLPVLRAERATVTVTGKEGVVRDWGTTILERQFGPIPRREFRRERLLDGPVIQEPPAGVTDLEDPATFADWYRVPLVSAAVSLAGGLTSGLLGGFRRRSGSGGPLPADAVGLGGSAVTG